MEMIKSFDMRTLPAFAENNYSKYSLTKHVVKGMLYSN